MHLSSALHLDSHGAQGVTHGTNTSALRPSQSQKCRLLERQQILNPSGRAGSHLI